MADNSQGTTIAFATSSWSGAAALTSATVDGITRAVRDQTSLSTTGARVKAPGKLVDYGTVSATVFFDPDDPPPFNSAAELITITFPVPTGKNSGATLSGTGFISSFSIDTTGGDEDEMSAASLEIQWGKHRLLAPVQVIF